MPLATYSYVASGASGSLTVTITPNSNVCGNLNLQLQITDNMTNGPGGPD